MKNLDKIEMIGRVMEVIPGGKFRVLLENNVEIIGHVSGKIRVNKISIFQGDSVTVELSPYDLGRGRIILRNR
jgi:translation initiation factor IF-1